MQRKGVRFGDENSVSNINNYSNNSGANRSSNLTPISNNGHRYPTPNNFSLEDDLYDSLALGSFNPMDAVKHYNATTLMENVQTPGTAARRINEIALKNFTDSSKYRMLPFDQ